MARFHMGVETALDPFTAKALRELPDHYHVCVGFNVPRTTRMAEALVLRLAGDQSALFMIGTLHLDAAVRGSAHGPWEIAVEEDGELYWDPYDTPLGDTNPLLGLQYTANKAQDWIAANLPMLEDPLHPWGSEVRPQVFPRLLIVSEQPVEVERHSWVWYFTEAQQLVEHLEAWRPRDPFPITPHVLRKLVQAFNLTPEEAWDERPLDISTEAVRDIQREWASLGEEIRTLRNVLNEAQEALGAIRSRGRLVDEALRHLIAGLEEKTASDRARAAAQEMDDDQDDYEEEPEPPPTPKRRPRVAAAPEPEPEPEPPKPARKTRAAKVIEAAPLDEDDEPEPEPEAPKPRRRVLKAEAAPAPAAAVETAPVRRRRTATTDSAEDLPLRGQVSAAGGYEQSTGTTSWEDEAPPAPPPPVVIVHAEADEELPKLVQEPVTIGTATLHVRERQTPTAPATPIIRERPTPIATPTTPIIHERQTSTAAPATPRAAADAPRPEIKTRTIITRPSAQPAAKPEEESEPVDFSAYAPNFNEIYRPAQLAGPRFAAAPAPRFRNPLMKGPTGVTTGKEPMRLLPAAIRGLPHNPSARTADRIERAFRRTMPHFALGPFGYPNFEAFLLSAIEQGIIRGGGGTYWLPEEGALPPLEDAAVAGGLAAKPATFIEGALASFLSLTEEQQRWLINQMAQIETRASFLTQRYLARGLTYGRPLFPMTEQEAEELVHAARRLDLLEEVPESSEDRPRFTLRLKRSHPFVTAALAGVSLPSLEPIPEEAHAIEA